MAVRHSVLFYSLLFGHLGAVLLGLLAAPAKGGEDRHVAMGFGGIDVRLGVRMPQEAREGDFVGCEVKVYRCGRWWCPDDDNLYQSLAVSSKIRLGAATWIAKAKGTTANLVFLK